MRVGEDMERVADALPAEVDRLRRADGGLSETAVQAQRHLASLTDYELQRGITDAAIALAIRRGDPSTPWGILKAAAAALEGKWSDGSWEAKVAPLVRQATEDAA